MLPRGRCHRRSKELARTCRSTDSVIWTPFNSERNVLAASSGLKGSAGDPSMTDFGTAPMASSKLSITSSNPFTNFCNSNTYALATGELGHSRENRQSQVALPGSQIFARCQYHGRYVSADFPCPLPIATTGSWTPPPWTNKTSISATMGPSGRTTSMLTRCGNLHSAELETRPQGRQTLASCSARLASLAASSSCSSPIEGASGTLTSSPSSLLAGSSVAGSTVPAPKPSRFPLVPLASSARKYSVVCRERGQQCCQEVQLAAGKCVATWSTWPCYKGALGSQTVSNM
jgi:hypothetical protein